MNLQYSTTVTQGQLIAISVFDEQEKYPVRIVGSSECSYCYDPSGAWYFNRLFVHRDYRGNGISSILLEKMLHYVKTLQIPLLLDINPYGDLSREQLEQFYIRHGFEKMPSGFLMFNKQFLKGEII